MIDVDPQDRSEPVAWVLPARHRVVGGASVSERDIEIAVRPKRDVAAIVVFKRVVGRHPDSFLARRVGGPWIAARSPKPRDDRTPVPRVFRRIIDEELLVFLVLGMKGQAEQAFFVALVDRIGKLEKELLVARRPIVGERPDRGGMLFDSRRSRLLPSSGYAKATGRSNLRFGNATLVASAGSDPFADGRLGRLLFLSNSRRGSRAKTAIGIETRTKNESSAHGR